MGEASRSWRDRVTITTKFGLQPPRNQRALGMIHRAVRPLVRRLPGLKSRLSRAAGGLTNRARFTPEELRQSVENSLRALQTDYIDVLLLHEACVDDLTDALFDQLERSVEQGKIRTYGVGSEVDRLSLVHQAEPRFCRVAQFEWSVFCSEKPSFAGSFQIGHRGLSSSFVRLRAALRANPEVTRSWSEAMGRDVTSPSVLSYLMLAAARNANPGGITLFSSRKAAEHQSERRPVAGRCPHAGRRRVCRVGGEGQGGDPILSRAIETMSGRAAPKDTGSTRLDLTRMLER